MSQLTMSKDGAISIPLELRAKHGFTAETPIRVVETRSGILLIPLTKGPISQELAHELEEWQSLSMAAWDMFPYEEKP